MSILRDIPGHLKRILGMEQAVKAPKDIRDGYVRNLNHMIRVHKQVDKLRKNPHRDPDRLERLVEELSRKTEVMERVGLGPVRSMRQCSKALHMLAKLEQPNGDC